MRRSAWLFSAAVVTCTLAGTARLAGAQDLPVLDPQHARLILQEVSGDAAYEHIRYQTHFHRPGGSNGLWAVAEYFEGKAREFGLENVQLIKQASTTPPWNATFADLWIVEPEPERIASTLQSVLHLADYSRTTDVTGELVDVGAGAEEDFEGLDVAGKVVLTYGSAFGVMQRAVGERGALGVVAYPSPFGGQSAYPDQLRWMRISSRASDDFEPTFAFGLSLRQGLELRGRVQRSEEPIVVHAVVESEFNSNPGPDPWQVMVEGRMRSILDDGNPTPVLPPGMELPGFVSED